MTTTRSNYSMRAALWVSLAVAFGFIAARVVPLWSVTSIWDDAFFFARYANNLVVHGVMAWNPGEPPSYGLTSQWYMLIVLPLRLALAGNPGAIMVAASMISGAAFLVCAGVMIWRDPDHTPTSRLAVMVVVTAALASSAALTPHFGSGMDTMFVMAFITVYLILAQNTRREASKRNIVAMGVWGGLAYFARPDLLLYTLIVPGMLMVMARDWPSARRYAGVLAITMVVVALQAGFAAVYYQSPLPLPFYNKQLGIGGQTIPELFRDWPQAYLAGFATTYLPFLLVIAVSLMISHRQWLRRSAALEIGVLIATLLYIAYYRFGVFQIMPYYQRFYHPTLPAIIFLAARGLAWLRSQLPELSRLTVFNSPAASWAIPVALALGLTVNLTQLDAEGQGHPRSHNQWFGMMDVHDGYRAQWSHYLYGLDRFSALPSDLVIATSEIGLPSVMNPDKIIFDMSGLTDRNINAGGFSVDYLFTKYQPDVLYLPSYDYTPDIWRRITDHPTFLEHYVLYPAGRIGAILDVAIYKQSPYYTELEAIMNSPGE